MIDYTVADNDTLKGIADYFNVNIDDLKKANNLSSEKIETGMILKIPFTPKLGYYSVLDGDDLYSIASKYKMPVEILAKLNGLRVDEYIYPNQKLLIPLEGYRVYITNSGDTILGIKNLLGVSLDNIVSENSDIYLLPEQLIVYKDS